MPDIHPFRAIRYRLETPEQLSQFVAPPYDMIDQAGIQRLYNENPHNVVRIIQNQPEPSDTQNRQRHQRAASLFRQWRHEGILEQDPAPRMYIYRQTFTAKVNGREGRYSRTGLIARVALHDFSENVILPHENTLSAPKADRYEQLDEMRCNTEKIFGLVPDEGDLFEAISGAVPEHPTGVFVDSDNVRHELFALEDPQILEKLRDLMRQRQVLIADGHHRYETALRFHRETKLPGSESVMMTLVSMKDPGLVVRSFHRLVRRQESVTPPRMVAGLQTYFDLNTHGNLQADAIGALLQKIGQQQVLFFDSSSGNVSTATLNAAGESFLKTIGNDRSSNWNHLNVSLLNSMVVNKILGLPLDGTVLHDVLRYEKDIAASRDIASDSSAFYGCFFLRPIKLDTIRTIVEGGERMPQKSTNFFPKIYSGLVFNPLEQL